MAGKQKVSKDITTGIGVLSFPRVFASTANDKTDSSGAKTGEKSYDIQILIPKSQRADCKALAAAMREVGEAEWGADRWRKVRLPLRDGDKEAEEMAQDGQTKGEKYPERLGCYFLNARSTKPVPVIDRNKVLIDNPDDLYGGVIGRLAISFYVYSNNGNTGIGVSLNGVQKVRDGEPLGMGSRPSVDAMFVDDLAEEDDDILSDDADEEPEPEPVKKAPAKKTAAKKAPAKKAPEPEEDDDDLDVLGDDEDDDADDLYDDL